MTTPNNETEETKPESTERWWVFPLCLIALMGSAFGFIQYRLTHGPFKPYEVVCDPTGIYGVADRHGHLVDWARDRTSSLQSATEFSDWLKHYDSSRKSREDAESLEYKERREFRRRQWKACE